VKRLSAVETLGSTSVICTDKTGTLTENRMRAVLTWTSLGELAQGGDTDGATSQQVRDRLAEALSRCNTAELDPARPGRGSGDPTDVALLEAARVLGADVDPLRRAHTRRQMFHFDPQLRLMSTVDAEPRGTVVHTKGAPEDVLARSVSFMGADGAALPLDAARRAEVAEAIGTYAARGLRLLAAAQRELGDEPIPDQRVDAERDLTLLGVVALFDPPRPEVKAAVEECHRAGIRIIVVTGDHRLTAGEIARQVGIGTNGLVPVNADELDSLTESEFDRVLARGEEMVLARSSPEMKMRVTDALQAAGHVVAMTGDGVNDAPALRRADIGIAMGENGTEVAREAATMVLTDDNFRTIASAV
jgi:magnesium-transporting ATPase (P-type)